MTEILSNIWFWIGLITLTITGLSIVILVHQKKLSSLGKCHISCMEELSRCLSNGEVEINQNFHKIQSCLNTLEHEIFSIAKNVTEPHFEKDLKTGSTLGYWPITPLVRTKSIKPIGKKAKKFLTIKGEIKKKYRDNPIAQKCYEKFQALKQD